MYWLPASGEINATYIEAGTRCDSDSICTGGSEAAVGAESDVPLRLYATVVLHRKALLT